MLTNKMRGAGIGDQIGRVACSPWLDDMGHLAAGLDGDGAENLPHREAGAGAEIVRAAGVPLQQELQRQSLGGSKSNDSSSRKPSAADW